MLCMLSCWQKPCWGCIWIGALYMYVHVYMYVWRVKGYMYVGCCKSPKSKLKKLVILLTGGKKTWEKHIHCETMGKFELNVLWHNPFKHYIYSCNHALHIKPTYTTSFCNSTFFCSLKLSGDWRLKIGLDLVINVHVCNITFFDKFTILSFSKKIWSWFALKSAFC